MLRLLLGVRTPRGNAVFRRLRAAFREGRARFGFRLVHYSVQHNHFHFICEADDRRALSRGLQGLTIRLARILNRVSGRCGKVFAERYHEHTLRTPLEVRRALRYVLFNERHHLARLGKSLPPWWLDPCSFAPEFAEFARDSDLPPHATAPPETTVPARCFLLRHGYKRHGTLRIDEAPS